MSSKSSNNVSLIPAVDPTEEKALTPLKAKSIPPKKVYTSAWVSLSTWAKRNGISPSLATLRIPTLKAALVLRDPESKRIIGVRGDVKTVANLHKAKEAKTKAAKKVSVSI